ncbi:MAG: acetate--CoA ligase [Rhodospirillales bacterium]|nr:acetate--CoA ligase [Alphaproteobacteria bacterium]USO03829.1 MAG: acetate--CoA ligase [Rhodospirillales bacterium]
MSEKEQIFPPPESLVRSAHITAEKYKELYARSLKDPEGFWEEMSRRLDWFTPPKKIKNTSFDKPVSIKWYEDGMLNACYNCIDRHLPEKENDVALIWEGDEPALEKKITYGELKGEVCRLANALKERGVSKGDRVTIYMPMVPEAVYAMLACARIGAVHSVVFGGFSPESLKNRILDCGSEIIITADEGVRGGKKIPLKNNVDEAVKSCPGIHTVLVLEHMDGEISWNEKHDIWWHELVDDQPSDCPCEMMNAEDPLFILYTSGSTGKPKGVLHTTGGYMVYAALTHEWVFDYKAGDIYWCTADVGWVTGHSYIVYGPLANGATSLVFEGVPNYPDWSRFWQVVDKHKVNIFYTAPTAIRSLIKAGNEFVTKTDRSSLRVLGTVGEPINHEAWMWYHEIVGGGRCPIVDTWWQTETGGHLITPLPGAMPTKPGSAGLPFFGIQAAIVDKEGHILEGDAQGVLCILDSWPGQMRTLYGDHERFEETYFSAFPGKYFTGDGARRDKDGYYWITGRTDDVINVSGHRLGTAEIESAIDEHSAVAEAAVVGFPHEIKGQGIYAYVTLREGFKPDETVKQEIIQTIRTVIGPIATPDVIQWAPGLPKTRSGKIMRRILRKIAANEYEDLGDTSTLAEPDIVDNLIQGRNKA